MDDLFQENYFFFPFWKWSTCLVVLQISATALQGGNKAEDSEQQEAAASICGGGHLLIQTMEVNGYTGFYYLL